jgi:hypothetical protein
MFPASSQQTLEDPPAPIGISRAATIQALVWSWSPLAPRSGSLKVSGETSSVGCMRLCYRCPSTRPIRKWPGAMKFRREGRGTFPGFGLGTSRSALRPASRVPMTRLSVHARKALGLLPPSRFLYRLSSPRACVCKTGESSCGCARSA